MPQKLLVLAAPGAETESAAMAPCSAAIPAILAVLPRSTRPPQTAEDNENAFFEFPNRIARPSISGRWWVALYMGLDTKRARPSVWRRWA